MESIRFIGSKPKVQVRVRVDKLGQNPEEEVKKVNKCEKSWFKDTNIEGSHFVMTLYDI